MNKFFFFAILFFLIKGEIFAQFSPGELSRVHSRLEGVENCTQCHEAGKKLSANKCLACHKILKQEIDAGKGLHSNPEYKTCQKCHVEHLGRDFSLIHWKNGMENFNHADTKFELKGKHATLKCRDCHQPKNIQNKESFRAQQKDLKKTFLGLSSTCTSCHIDEHRGELGKDCLKCHTQEKWKPASGFDHNQSNFPLTGKHLNVSCEKCHPKVTDNKFVENPDFLKFTGLKFRSCGNCHRDVHRGKLGSRCQRCHTTRGWRQFKQGSFNHDRTRFPLRGKHRLVKCQKCHGSRQRMTGLKFQRCRDCHADFHRSQFSSQYAKLDCQKCHTENGFVPALFSMKDHEDTLFPLAGAHRAIPCNSCHKPIWQGKKKTVQFKFVSLQCQGCHKDPHLGDTQKISGKNGCLSCHSVDSWKEIKFDHQRTKFPLQGKHAATACIQCHKPQEKKRKTGKFRTISFSGLSRLCQGCHRDPHGKQFAVTVVVRNRRVALTHCEKCHGTHTWENLKFDHNRDSNFKLEGAHLKVGCKACHPTKQIGNQKLVIYRPLDNRCQACHASKT